MSKGFFEKVAADKSQLGFDYQDLVCLEYLIELKPGESVGLEVFDDVHHERISGTSSLVQVKHSVSEDSTLTNRDIDLWKTLYNWSMALDTLDSDNIEFVFFTNKKKTSQSGVVQLLDSNKVDITALVKAISEIKLDIDTNQISKLLDKKHKDLRAAQEKLAKDGAILSADERKAKEIVDLRVTKSRHERMSRQQAAKLENMFSDMGSAQVSKLNLIVKTDVRGSLEAINSSLHDFATDEVAVDIVASGVGGITESDINLALTTGAIILGFNVRAGGSAKALAEKESVEIRYYSIIYNLLDEVKSALSGMLAPETREEIVGIAEVRDVFRSPKFGAIAGCMVIEGSVQRSKPIRVLRDDVVIYQGELESLRRFKDEASEVRNGMECGIGVKDYNDVKAGDLIEVYDVTEVKRSL